MPQEKVGDGTGGRLESEKGKAIDTKAPRELTWAEMHRIAREEAFGDSCFRIVVSGLHYA